jgi:hypothetical protein
MTMEQNWRLLNQGYGTELVFVILRLTVLLSTILALRRGIGDS